VILREYHACAPRTAFNYYISNLPGVVDGLRPVPSCTRASIQPLLGLDIAPAKKTKRRRDIVRASYMRLMRKLEKSSKFAPFGRREFVRFVFLPRSLSEGRAANSGRSLPRWPFANDGLRSDGP